MGKESSDSGMNASLGKERSMTEEERLELARKLDEDIERFMDGLAARKNSEEKKPFNFDEWCKDLEQHPAFMTDLKPNARGEFSEAVQALQALKYDEGSSTEERIENAKHHKEEGNKFFKFKKYRWACDCYTNGIKIMCADRELNSVLYANRAAAQKHLSNIRGALRDCVFARKFDSSNYKAVIRGAECLIELGYGQQCIDWIESSRLQVLKTDDETEKRKIFMCELSALEKEAARCQMVEARNARREKLVEKRETAAKKRLLDAFAKRDLRFKPCFSFNSPGLFEWSQIEVRLPQTQLHEKVLLDDDGVLHWPLLIQYPEFGQVDFVKECCEENTLGQVLESTFQQPADWDPKHLLRPENVRYFVTLDVYDENEVSEVYPDDTLKAIFSTRDYVIVQGLPVIQMYTKERANCSFSHVTGRLHKIL